MTNIRLWIIGSLLTSALLIAAGWFIGVSPMLDKGSQADADRVAAEGKNQVLEQALGKLKSQYVELPNLKSQLAATRSALPETADMASFLGSIDTLQSASGAVITNVAVSDGLPYAPVVPAPVAAPAPAAGSAPASGTSAASGSTPAAGKSPTPTPVAATMPNAQIVNAELVKPDNFIAIPVSVSAAGTFAQVMDFINGMQGSARIYLVTGLAVAQDVTTGRFSATIDGFAYVLLPSAAGTGTSPASAAAASGSATNAQSN